MIYHITTGADWEQAQLNGHYTADSLATEGFIHCSARHQVETVANSFYRDVDDLVLLCIEEDDLTSELKWEDPAHPTPDSPSRPSDDDLFPHIYGVINLDAVKDQVRLLRTESGDYALSPETP